MADIIAVSTLSTVSTILGSVYAAYKFGTRFSRKKLFEKIAKYILVKIFNEVKDNEKIRQLAEDLKKKFGEKTFKELKSFISDLVDIEKDKKVAKEDTFFIKHKEEILKNVESLKQYVMKREMVKSFTIFSFTRLYHTHIDIKFFLQLQNELLEDAVLNTNISPEDLEVLLQEIYTTSNEMDFKDFDTEIALFEKEKVGMLDVLGKVKTKIGSNKVQRRLLDFFRENIEAMTLTRDMVKYSKMTSESSLSGKIGSNPPNLKPSLSTHSNSTESTLLSQIAQLKNQLNQS